MLARLLTLSRQSLVYGLGSFASRFVSLVFTPVYTRLLHTTGYGDLGVILSAVALLTVLLTLGIDSAALFFYNREESAEGKSAVLSTWLAFAIVLSVTVCTLLILAAGPLSALLLSRTSPLLVRIALASVPLSLVLTIMLETLRINMKPWRYSILSVTNLLLTVSLNVM